MASVRALPKVLLLISVSIACARTIPYPAHPRIYFADVPDYFKSNPFEPKKGGGLDDRIFGSELFGNLISRDAELWTTHWSGAEPILSSPSRSIG